MSNQNPHLIFCPYLPLERAATIGDWFIGPPDALNLPWLSEAFKAASLRFLSKFQDADGQPLKRPVVIAHRERGFDGQAPTPHDGRAIQLALHFGLLDTNPVNREIAGWQAATSDNSDLFVWSINVAGGGVGTQRGSLVTVTTFGGQVTDPAFAVRAPLELHLPFKSRLHVDAANAIYRVARGDHDDVDAIRAHRLSTAVHWLAKAWRNTPNIGMADRVVMLRTAMEALVGTSRTGDAIRVLESIFQALVEQGADAATTQHMLWSPDDQPHREMTLTDERGKSRTFQVSDLGHWFSSFGQTRHLIVHEGQFPSLDYEQPGSPYNGPLFWVGERFVREAVKASLVTFGYTELWQEETFRAMKDALRRATNTPR